MSGPADGAGDVAALFAAVAGIGPFFAVATGPPPAGGGWVPLRDLAGAPAPDDPLTVRIATVRAALDTDARVAASTAFQTLVAQIVAPLLAAAAVAGAIPAGPPGALPPGPAAVPPGPGAVPPGPPGPSGATWRPVALADPLSATTRDHDAVDGLADALHWRPGGTGPGLWWAPGGRVLPCPDGAVLGAVLTGLLAPLVGAVRARASVAPRVLWGDAASAVASARRLVAQARPGAAERATALAGHLLTTPPLDVTAGLRDPEPPDRRWTFRRRSCCLYYRVPGGGLCGDCVLLDRGRPRR